MKAGIGIGVVVIAACSSEPSDTYQVTIHGHGAVAIGDRSVACEQGLCTDAVQVQAQGLESGLSLLASPAENWELTSATIDGTAIVLVPDGNVELALPGDHAVDVVFSERPACTPTADLAGPPGPLAAYREVCVGQTLTIIGRYLANLDGSGACAYFRAQLLPASAIEPFGSPAGMQVVKIDIPLGYPVGRALFLDRTLDGQIGASFGVVDELPLPRPQSVSPTTATPGTQVTVTGTELDHVLSVTFDGTSTVGGIPAAFSVTPTSFVFTVPDLPAGQHTVNAYTACGQATTSPTFTVVR